MALHVHAMQRYSALLLLQYFILQSSRYYAESALHEVPPENEKFSRTRFNKNTISDASSVYYNDTSFYDNIQRSRCLKNSTSSYSLPFLSCCSNCDSDPNRKILIKGLTDNFFSTFTYSDAAKLKYTRKYEFYDASQFTHVVDFTCNNVHIKNYVHTLIYCLLPNAYLARLAAYDFGDGQNTAIIAQEELMPWVMQTIVRQSASVTVIPWHRYILIDRYATVYFERVKNHDHDDKRSIMDFTLSYPKEMVANKLYNQRVIAAGDVLREVVSKKVGVTRDSRKVFVHIVRTSSRIFDLDFIPMLSTEFPEYRHVHFLGSESPSARARLFASAAIVVGFHGDENINAIFCPHQAVIVEITFLCKESQLASPTMGNRVYSVASGPFCFTNERQITNVHPGLTWITHGLDLKEAGVPLWQSKYVGDRQYMAGKLLSYDRPIRVSPEVIKLISLRIKESLTKAKTQPIVF